MTKLAAGDWAEMETVCVDESGAEAAVKNTLRLILSSVLDGGACPHVRAVLEELVACCVTAELTSAVEEGEREGQTESLLSAMGVTIPHMSDCACVLAPVILGAAEECATIVIDSTTQMSGPQGAVEVVSESENESCALSEVGLEGKPREADEEDAYTKLWTARKREVERKAEDRARVIVQEWQRDRRGLEEIIDNSLKEYAELYEAAHALRLQFEAEKAKWMARVLSVHAGQFPAAGFVAYNPGLMFQYDADVADCSDDTPSPRKRPLEDASIEAASSLSPAPPKKRFVAPKKELMPVARNTR